jgi:hypothetical protein
MTVLGWFAEGPEIDYHSSMESPFWGLNEVSDAG